MTHTYKTSCLDLQQIHQSGQCFRMIPLPEGSYPRNAWNGYRVISSGRLLRAWQDEDHIYLDCREEDLSFWLSYFDMDTDYQAVMESIDREDHYLREAARQGNGIRILRQDPWEMIITFVISQQKTIPNIRQLVEALSRRYGSPLSTGQEDSPLPLPYSFPTACQLSCAALEELLELKLGYRAKYIHRLCQDTVSGALDLHRLNSLSYDDAMEYLCSFYGIGKKVANCVCLFGLHHVGAFPVDTWIGKILMEQYYDSKKYRGTPKSRLLDQMVQENFGRYGGCAGIMQQYIFYYQRLRNSRLS